MDSINEELSLDELTDLSRAVKNVLESINEQIRLQ